jgi:hypothetical protein
LRIAPAFRAGKHGNFSRHDAAPPREQVVALSTREKYIGLAVGATVLLAGLYQLVIDPFMDEGQSIQTKQSEIKKELDAADILFRRRVALLPLWSEMNKVGGLKSDAFDARTQIEQSLANWAHDSRVALVSVHPDDRTFGNAVDRKSEKPEARFEPIVIHAIGLGSMAQIANLLWKVESAPKLLRITDIHITPRVEATDDLQIQLNVATVSLRPDASLPKPAENSRRTARSDNEP